MTQPWWLRHLGLLEHELEELDVLGYRPFVDPEARDRHQVICVTLHVPRPDTGEVAELVATYPDLYPHFRPVVEAPHLLLGRHQHPFGRTLCLLARGTRHWHSGMSLAQLISGQLPKLLDAVNAGAGTEAAALEENAGEPFSDYYETWPQAAVLTDGNWHLPADVAEGSLLLGYDGADRVRGAVLEIYDDDGNTLASAAPEIRELYDGQRGKALGRRTVRCRWFRLDAPPATNEAKAIDQQLSGREHGLRASAHRIQLAASADPTEATKGSWDVVALLYPEEVAYQRTGDGWLFLARRITGGKKSKVVDRRLVRAWRTGPDDVTARVPSTTPLRGKSLLLVGAGAVGAPLALELARAGVGRLRIWDHDVVDPATSPRWPAGVSSAGRPKASWLVDAIAREYPYTEAIGINIRVGTPRLQPMHLDGEETTELALLADAIDDVDLIVDATAELGVQHALSTLAWEHDVDYLCLSATMGAWGGIVARIRPPTTGCWTCYLLHMNGREPPEDPGGSVQPEGCADVTFTGTGFDLQRVSMEAARLAVGTLCAGHDDGYPNPAWDVAVLRLRDEDGTPIPASWEASSLTPHADRDSGLHP